MCKICHRNFENGRALGGHMRSHMLNLSVPPKTEQLVQETESTQSSSSDEEEDNQEEEDKGVVIYGLRENPKKSIRLIDQEFSSSIVLDQENVSETESSRNHHIVRRNAKRERQIESLDSDYENLEEEDIAYCLIMLSRDKWGRNEAIIKEQEDYDYGDSDYEERVKVSKSSRRNRGKYKCESCEKVFRSYQALGGHRASHKKMKMVKTEESGGERMVVEGKRHECPFCFRVFASGQALGGHKRIHVLGGGGASSVTDNNKSSSIISTNERSLIDLNLPAPVDDYDYDDEFSQVEFSAVSDEEFV